MSVFTFKARFSNSSRDDKRLAERAPSIWPTARVAMRMPKAASNARAI